MTCLQCGTTIPLRLGRGRPRKYCNAQCRRTATAANRSSLGSQKQPSDQCRNGHPSEGNTYERYDGTVGCVVCRSNRQERRRLKARRLGGPDRVIDLLLIDPTFQVDIHGRVWTSRDLQGRPTEAAWRRYDRLNQSGYFMVYYNGVVIQVNRLVYRKFHGPLVPGLHVDHIDGDPTNNDPSNLQQITPAKNTQKGRTARLTEVDVQRIRAAQGNMSAVAAAKRWDIGVPHVYKIWAGVKWRDV